MAEGEAKPRMAGERPARDERGDGERHLARKGDEGGQYRRSNEPLEFARRQFRGLQRHHAEGDEALRRAGGHLGDRIVHVTAEGERVARLEPIRQQLGHRREHLARNAGAGHRLDTAVDVPTFIADRPENLAGNHHRRVPAIRRHLHLRPAQASIAAGVFRKGRRHDMRMNVDRTLAHQCFSCANDVPPRSGETSQPSSSG